MNIRNKIILFTLLFCLCSKSFLDGEILKCTSFSKLTKFANQDTLVLVDLDNCLIEGETRYGHAEWFYDAINKMVSEGKERKEAIQMFYPKWLQSQRVAKVKLVDPLAKEVIDSLQKRGVSVIGFTNRQPPTRFATLNQLTRLGISFEPIFMCQGELIIPFAHSPRFIQGVLFVHGGYNKKGEVLTAFLDYIGLKPKRIIFIDDKDYNLVEVEEALKDRPIEFFGFHFCTLAMREKEWHPDVAAIQKKMTGKILSNRAAQFLLDQEKTD